MGAEVYLAALQVAAGVASGKQQEAAYESQAQAIELQAEQDINKINRELEDALAMQSAIFGGQGRVMEGSTLAVQAEDNRRAAEDIAGVEATAAAGAQAARQAGEAARSGSIIGGGMSGAGSLLRYGEVS